TAPIPDIYSPQEKDHMEGLRSGFSFSGDVDFYMLKYFGIGLKYNYFYKRNTSELIVSNAQGIPVSLNVDSKLSLNYIAPKIVARLISPDNLHVIIAGISAGYYRYLHLMKFDDQFEIRGSSLGYAFDFGYEYILFKNFAIGLNASCIFGQINEFYINQDKSEYYKDWSDITQINIGIGIRYYH
ncbi:hypothetical protein ACFLRY_04945, partial [Bacteroidota bacterium]